MDEEQKPHKTWIMLKKAIRTKYIPFTECPWSTGKWVDEALSRPTTLSSSESKYGTFNGSLYISNFSDNKNGVANVLNKTSSVKVILPYNGLQSSFIIECPDSVRIKPETLQIVTDGNGRSVQFIIYGINEDDTLDKLGSNVFNSSSSSSKTFNYTVSNDKYYKGFNIKCRDNTSNTAQTLTFKSFECLKGTLKIN